MTKQESVYKKELSQSTKFVFNTQQKSQNEPKNKSPITKFVFNTQLVLGAIKLGFGHQSTKFVFNTQLYLGSPLKHDCHQSTKFVFNTQKFMEGLALQEHFVTNLQNSSSIHNQSPIFVL